MSRKYPGEGGRKGGPGSVFYKTIAAPAGYAQGAALLNMLILEGDKRMASVNRMIPILVYRDVEKAHDFLVNVFGFEPVALERDDAGHVRHAAVKAGETTIYLHRETEDGLLVSPEQTGRASGGMLVMVSDADAHCARLQTAGARITYGPVDQSYGLREFEALDSEGHRWWFAAEISEKKL